MIWLNGEVSDGPTVTLDASDRGLLLGDGLFETLAAFDGKPFRQSAHWDRLIEGAAHLGFAVSRERLDEAACALLWPGEHAVLRVTVTRGPGPRGLMPPTHSRPTILASTAPWRAAGAFRSVSLATSSIRRNRHSPLASIKSLQYLDNVLALRDAQAQGTDDALMLNDGGTVACASASNVFAVLGTRLVTPPRTDGVLPGIMRRLTLQVALGLGLEPAEASLEPADLRAADAVLLTNSVRLLSVVHRLDGAELRSQSSAFPALIAAQIAEAIEGETGVRLLDLPDVHRISSSGLAEN